MAKRRFDFHNKKTRNILSMGFAFLVVAVLVLAVSKTVSDSPVSSSIKESGIVVFIDAGHGGKDNGATLDNDKRNEKDDNLKIALAVQDSLNKKGVQVEMSRSTDVFLTLQERCDMANNSDAQLFVSLHRNSAETGQGVEIWAKSTKPKPDTTLANYIMDNLDNVGISKNRGVRFGSMSNPKVGYYVNNATDMPSCLVEMGFITSEKDNQLFDKNLTKYANAIAKGIVETINKLELKPITENLV